MILRAVCDERISVPQQFPGWNPPPLGAGQVPMAPDEARAMRGSFTHGVVGKDYRKKNYPWAHMECGLVKRGDPGGLHVQVL